LWEANLFLFMGVFDFLKNKFLNRPSESEQLFNEILVQANNEIKKRGESYWSFKLSDLEIYKTTLQLTDKEKLAFIVYCVQKISSFYKDRKSFSSDELEYQLSSISQNFVSHLVKTKLDLDEKDITLLTDAFLSNGRYAVQNIFHWPISLLVTHIGKSVSKNNLTELLKANLLKIKNAASDKESAYYDKERVKLIEKIDKILFEAENGKDVVKPIFFPGKDDFADYANDIIKNIPENERLNWFKLMAVSQKASGAKPSKKYMDESKELIKEFGQDKFKKILNEWISAITVFKEKEITHVNTYNNQEYTYTNYEFLAAPNIEMIKGFVWMSAHFHDKTTLINVASLAERAFRKIPGKGPAAPAVGNACLYALANSKGLDGVGHLSRLKLRIKQSSTQNLIDKYLNEAAEKEGVTVYEIEDMAVDDYGLVDGKRTYEFDEYKAVLEITGVGKTELYWFKRDGSPQKSVPAFVKEKYNSKLKKIKETAKQIELTVSAQRDRIDRMLKSNRSLTYEKFNEFYFSHGLMSYLSKKIIWIFEKNLEKKEAINIEGKWMNAMGDDISDLISPESIVQLWHPVFYSIEEISRWREFMMANKIIQPLKQSFREVYLLTDAEINTRTYSNRMAAHILKQHQFNSLAKTRGWKYSLLGAYDDGRDNETAELVLPDYNLKAEFWISEVNADDAFNDTGIWFYVSTDQVRFINLSDNSVVELLEVPRLALTEVMRDVDLFVGVASVGNDPTWRDNGGLPLYRDYWQAYSFGDLTEVAKTRKSILERLVPRLKIAAVSEIKDKFLVVKGKLRIYKIHIGSTNILMEPNDQYLCIVPDRSQKTEASAGFIPFEGDNGLSIIISKALLLANDDKITDVTITRQIKPQ
jgi:hypothetical protein